MTRDVGQALIIISGPSGVGKTSVARALSVFIDAPSAVVTERLLARGDTDVAARMRDNLKV